MKIKIILFAFGLTALISCNKQKAWELSSPNAEIKASILLDEAGNVSYTLFRMAFDSMMEVIKKSPLGIDREDQTFSKSLEFQSISNVEKIEDGYLLTSGKKLQCSNTCNQVVLTFKNENSVKIEIICRAYNDGFAFRYNFPDKDSKIHTIKKEHTGFSVGSGQAWMLKYDKATEWSPAYEVDYTNGVPIGTSAPDVEGWSFPALFKTNTSWILLSEAGLDGSYCASHLEKEAPNGLYSIRLSEQGDGLGTGKAFPESTLPWSTPWRVVILGTLPGDIVKSTLITDLAEPSKIEDVSWIKAGNSSWSWWSDPESPKNFISLKKFVDFSKEMNWAYSLVDANWDLMKGGTVEELIEYANKSGVGIWLWYNSGGSHNKVTEGPRDILSDPVKRKEEFKRIAALGVKGIKVDFFQSDKQNIIQLYMDILQDAAENKIMVNFHGCTLPRGWSRTYPNLMSLEAAKGAENYMFSKDFPQYAPIHNCILPFTRNVVGPMDYTPVAFTEHNHPHLTTWGHEAALSIVFESGVSHFADKPEAFKKLPKELFEMFKNVPAAWDDVKVLKANPGKDVVIARQKDFMWYIGGINGENSEKELEINLSGMCQDGEQLIIVCDGDEKTKLSVEKIASTQKTVKIKLLPYGGFVIFNEKILAIKK